MHRLFFPIRLFFICLLAAPFTTFGQRQKPFEIQFIDSLQAADNSYFIYSLLSVKNNSSEASKIKIYLSAPPGWKIIGDSSLVETISPNTTLGIPITLIRKRNAFSSWIPLKMQLKDTSGLLIFDTFLVVKAPYISSFSVMTLRQNFEIAPGEQELQVPVYFHNKGTSEGLYSVFIRNAELSFHRLNLLRIAPGKDTTITLAIKIPLTMGQGDERILLQIMDSTGNSRSLPISFNRVYRSLKIHSSRFKTFPLSVEFGSFLVDRNFYYFAETRTNFFLKKGTLDLAFKTKTFGPNRTIEQNVLTAQYRDTKVNISIGQLTQFKHFYAYGRGLRVDFKNKLGNLIGFEGIVPAHRSVQSNSFFSPYFQHISKKITWLHRLAFDFDKRKGLNAYLLFNEAFLQLNSTSTLGINFSAGWEDFKRIRVFSNHDVGIGIGYNYLGRYKNWDWQSSWQYHQKSYPGANKGSRIIYQMMRWKYKKNSFDLSYQYNSTTSSILQDTIYIADAFFFNMQKLGIKWGLGLEKTMFSFGTGLFSQKGVSAGQLPQYQFAELAFSTSFSLKVKLALNSFTSFANNSLVSQPIWLTNSTIDFRMGRFGIKGFYVQQPLLKDSVLKYLIRYNQTALISPYFNFNLLQRLNGALRYSVSKSLYDQKITSSVGFNLNFTDKKKGWQITANGAIPITRSSAPMSTGFSFPYLTISIKKSLQFPSIFKRQYHNLSFLVFEDSNLNGLPDTAERKLSNLRLIVNEKNFLTDENGRILLTNTDTGFYKLNVFPSDLYKGLVPMEQFATIPLQNSKEVLVPMRRGCIVYGKVELDLDPYSDIKFTPENILVRAFDGQGKQYTVLTDSSGYFSISLPAGRYTVSLNPDAFSGSIKPERVSFSIDLDMLKEKEVTFKLTQRRREIRMRNF